MEKSENAKLWLRVGVTIETDKETMSTILNENEATSSKMLEEVFSGRRGTWAITGETYVPQDCVISTQQEAFGLKEDEMTDGDLDFSDIDVAAPCSAVPVMDELKPIIISAMEGYAERAGDDLAEAKSYDDRMAIQHNIDLANF